MKRTQSVMGVILLTAALVGSGFAIENGKGRQGPADMEESYVSLLPLEDLSDLERGSLEKMREEEKLARDVYRSLYDRWGVSIFLNIAASEQRHMDAVKFLMDKYGIADPIGDDQPGVFTDPQLAELYRQLTGLGEQSLEKALVVGATIEDLDIFDLQNYLLQVDNLDVIFVYGSLKKGSENHIRAFIRQLEAYGLSYQARYITAEDLEAILAAGSQSGGSGWRNGGGNGSGWRGGRD